MTELIDRVINRGYEQSTQVALANHYRTHFWTLLRALRQECASHSKGCECYICSALSKAEQVELP